MPFRSHLHSSLSSKIAPSTAGSGLVTVSSAGLRITKLDRMISSYLFLEPALKFSTRPFHSLWYRHLQIDQGLAPFHVYNLCPKCRTPANAVSFSQAACKSSTYFQPSSLILCTLSSCGSYPSSLNISSIVTGIPFLRRA